MPLGAIIMQLRSSVDAQNTDELNETFEAVTTDYLNQYFNAYYARTEQVPKNYYSNTELSTKSFGVYGVDGSFITTIEIEGTLSFNSDTLPTSEFIDTLLRNGFKGRNEQLYLDQLLNADDEFLQNLRYLIIDINKSTSEESPKRDDDSSASTNVSETSILDQEQPSTLIERTRSEKWILAFICVTCVVLFFLLLFCGWFLYKRSQKRKKESKENSNEGEEPLKVIKLPVKQQSSSSKKKNIDHKMISPTSTETTRSSPQSVDFPDRPPSPQRSMTSQASSYFTYTDNMSRWTTKNTTNQNRLKSAGSPFSKWSLDDLSSWRGGRQDPPAFRSDISAIPKQNDLNLNPQERDIEKGDANNKENSVRRNHSNKRQPSRKSRVALDERQSKSRHSNRSETYFYNGGYDDNDSDAGGEFTADDVICDLRDLSMQIRQQRRNTSSKRGAYNQ